MKKFLRLLGLVTISELESSIKSKDETIEGQKKELAELSKFFDKPEPTMEYKEFVEKNGLEESTWGHKHWNEYWAACYQANYLAHYMRDISRYPDLLNGLLIAIAEFPWDQCVQNYKDANWHWSDRTDRTPNKLEMIDNVIGLMHNAIVSERYGADGDFTTGGGWSSGGFEVSWENNKVLIKNDTVFFNKVIK